ncbi:MAG TPA: O-methyltransferase [Ktedonobacterales bacterium]|nr:O-methyltransferase [Ktedonobacterales bacterium]
MSGEMQQDDARRMRENAAQRADIDLHLTRLFAPEDDALRGAIDALAANDMPAIQISPLQGRTLQVLAAACGARKILEIGALSGYSSIWLARALPEDGRLISLEISEKHAAVARASLERAGLGGRAEVRVGPGEELLPALLPEGPFDLIFIDADKPGYPTYLDWAIKLSRPGSVIVADNCIRGGSPLHDDAATGDDSVAAVGVYDRRAASDPRLVSVALPMDDDGTDGFAISVVRDVAAGSTVS